MSDYILPMITGELWDALGIPGGWDDYFSLNKQNLVARCLTNDSVIYFRSCDREADLRGPNLGWFYIDEAAKVSLNTWKIMVGRIRREPERGWITTTPKGRNWIWDEFAKKPRENYDWFTGATDENKFLSKEYIESLKESYSGAFFRQEFLGEFTAWEGLVYPQINVETCHLDAPEDATGYRYAIAGCDWGFADPSVILVALVGNDGLVHLVDEYYKKRQSVETIAEAADKLRDKWGVLTYWCDPSRPDAVAALRARGLDSRKAKNDIDAGIAAVTRQIERGLFKMDFNRCPETANEFETYHYAEDDQGKILKDRPVDKDNHCMDALRYMIYSHNRQGSTSSRRGAR
jgi:PBSX family phage terminase large subunit